VQGESSLSGVRDRKRPAPSDVLQGAPQRAPRALHQSKQPKPLPADEGAGAPLPETRAPQDADGLVSIADFLGETLCAIDGLMKARADLDSQLPAGLPLPALDPDAHGQCVVDRALDAVLVLLGQAGSLPSRVLENDGKLKTGDEVAYFVSRGALSRLRAACGVSAKTKGRHEAVATLQKVARGLIEQVAPAALRVIQRSVPDSTGGAGAATPMPTTDSSNTTRAGGPMSTPMHLSVGSGAGGEHDTPPCADDGSPLQAVRDRCVGAGDARVFEMPQADVEFSEFFLSRVRSKITQSVQDAVQALGPQANSVASSVARLLARGQADVGEEDARVPAPLVWVHTLLQHLLPAGRHGDLPMTITSQLMYSHSRRLNHFQLVWAIRCRLVGAGPRLQNALRAQGVCMSRRTADSYLQELVRQVEDMTRKDISNAGALFWVVDNYESFFFKRALAGALGMYQRATAADLDVAQRQEADSEGVPPQVCVCCVLCLCGDGRGFHHCRGPLFALNALRVCW